MAWTKTKKLKLHVLDVVIFSKLLKKVRFEYAQLYIDSVNKVDSVDIELPKDVDSIMKIAEGQRKKVLAIFKRFSGLSDQR